MSFDIYNHQTFKVIKTADQPVLEAVHNSKENKASEQAFSYGLNPVEGYEDEDDGFAMDRYESQEEDPDMYDQDLGMYAGFDNMNEEEMMKLAIEMSLQDKTFAAGD